MTTTEAIAALMLALRRADVCRDHSSIDAICEPCWTDLQSAFDALNATVPTVRTGACSDGLREQAV